MSPTPAVFLSYSRTDRAACIALKQALQQAGFASVFRDEDSIRVGDRWMTVLQEALQSCCAFVLLVGRDGVQRWVGAEVEIALKRHLAPHEDSERLPIFPVLLADEGARSALPPLLALFQSTPWSPAEAVPEALLDAVKARAIRYDTQPQFEGCPFLGLSAFRRDEARLFFGRRQETLDALACLGDQGQTNPEKLSGSSGANYHRWLQIEGNSGAGKSSLVAAGMLPLIEQGWLWARTGFEHWQVLGPMLPGKQPLQKVAECLEHALVPDAHQRDMLGRTERLQRGGGALASELRNFKQAGGAFLLIVDQFEELFTFAEEAERARFDALLAHALQDPECPLFLISTVRADFLDRYELLPALGAIYNSLCKRYFLPTISEQGLREVIDGPARLAGLSVGEVRDAILADARGEIGALPLVENALTTLWEQKEPDGERHRLSGARYRDQGGLAGMLRTSADDLLKRIDAAVPKGKDAALEVLFALTRINDEGRNTRRRITRAEAIAAAGGGANGERVLSMLSGERDRDAPSDAHIGSLRLIATEQQSGQAGAAEQYVDLIHETLIRARGKDEKTGKAIGYWPALYDYVEANRDRDIVRQQLKFRAERWQHSRGLGRLWNLAYAGVGAYGALRMPADSSEGQFLRHSRWAQRLLISLLVLSVGYLIESFVTVKRLGLPMEAMPTLQRYRLGYAPLPKLTDKDIAPGPFKMGERDSAFREQYRESDRRYWGAPLQEVNIKKGFRLTVTEITYEQFDYFVYDRFDYFGPTSDKKRQAPTSPASGRGTRPVVNVDWHQASAYAEWLGARIKQDCRLPTEAEWEYAARAGGDSAYPWGDEVGEGKASCKGCGGVWGEGVQSAPVASFRPNAWGLHDMSGNVWEWTCSAWRDEFDGSEQDCADANDSSARVVRGGSWYDVADFARASARSGYVPARTDGSVGFRVLCSSPIE